ncbi:MAG: YgjV family protein, partial [Chitinispirillales bacterium]|nr:YgjV family protein [Chitinispirillales bacterium]
FFLFLILQIGATILGWVSWWSFLTLALLLNTYGQWQTNKKILRICLLISSLIIGCYCFHAHAYTGAINKWLQALSAIVSIMRYREKNIVIYS